MFKQFPEFERLQASIRPHTPDHTSIPSSSVHATPSSGIRTPTTLSQLEHQHKRYQEFSRFASIDPLPSQRRYKKIYAAAKRLLAERNLWRQRYNELFSSRDDRAQRRTTRKRLPDVGQVLTGEYLEELEREMALDGEDSMADDDTVSDASGESLLQGFSVSRCYNPELAAQQTAATGLQKSQRRFPILDHPRPVRRQDRIIPV